MLEIEITLTAGQVGGLLDRLARTWPGVEFETTAGGLRFHLGNAGNIDMELARLEKNLQAFEEARQIGEFIPVSVQNLTGPDAGGPAVSIGRFLITSPEYENQSENEQTRLILFPSAAFGTGVHPSTRLALGALEEFYARRPGRTDRTAARVLDAGTGSGILALAAARLGSGPVLAVDPDAQAIEAAARNVQANGFTDRITLRQMGISGLTGEFDLALANLVPSVLIKSGRTLVNLMAEEGRLVASGFTDSQTPGILKALHKAGATVIKSYSRDGWSALLVNRGRIKIVPQ